MRKTNTGDELQFALSVFRDGLERGGCLVCRALADAESRSLHSFLYEGMTTAPALLAFLAGGGFCPQHFRWAMRLGVNRWSVGCVELAILSRHILPRAAKEAAGIRAARGRGRLFARQRTAKSSPTLFPGRDCIFCQEWKEREERFVNLLELVVDRAEFSPAVSAGGLCLPHSAKALSAWKSDQRAEKLSRVLQAKIDTLGGNLKAFLEKYEERQRNEPFGPEIDAVEHAADFLNGFEPQRSGPQGEGPTAPAANNATVEEA
jgi:uncharacterized protein DUF6062